MLVKVVIYYCLVDLLMQINIFRKVIISKITAIFYIVINEINNKKALSN